MWYIYKVELYSAIKKNEIILFAGKWMDLENFMGSIIREVQKIKGHMCSYVEAILISYIHIYVT
jgi:hypothetical protein